MPKVYSHEFFGNYKDKIDRLNLQQSAFFGNLEHANGNSCNDVLNALLDFVSLVPTKFKGV